MLTVVSAPFRGAGAGTAAATWREQIGEGVIVDQEQQRDHAEEAANRAILETGDGEDDRLRIELRRWVPDRNLFVEFAEYPIAEPFSERSQAEWAGVVAKHLPGDLPVGIYAFRVFRPAGLLAAGELSWDGRVATRREGATAP